MRNGGLARREGDVGAAADVESWRLAGGRGSLKPPSQLCAKPLLGSQARPRHPITVIFGQAAPRSELFAIAEGMVSTLQNDGALRAHGLRRALAALPWLASLPIGMKENCRVHGPAPR